MNTETQSPLIPQGSLEQKSQGRTRFKLVVSIVLAVHGIALVALLMAGCQKEQEPALLPPPAPDQTQASAETNLQPQLDTPTDTAAAADTNTAAAPAVGAPADNTAALPPALPPEAASLTAPAVGTQDYKIVAGDTFSSLAKNFHVTVKALQEANPGVTPTKLQLNQTIKIPAPTTAAPTAATASAGAPTAEAASADAGTYEVKSGDTLSAIARKQGVSLRALRAANNLKTDRIKVGDKLKIPAKSTPAAAATPPTAATAPTPSPTQ